MALVIFQRQREKENDWHRGQEHGGVDLVVSGGVASNAFLRGRWVVDQTSWSVDGF